MPLEKSSKSVVRALGFAVSLVCCLYVVGELIYDDSVLTSGFSIQFLGPLVGATVCWIFVNAALGVGWASVVRALGHEMDFKASIFLAFRTQFAKYLPGNVFHHVGRVVFAKQQGLKASTATTATVLESILLLLLAGLLGVSFLFNQGYALTAFAIAAAGTILLSVALIHPLLRSRLGLSESIRVGHLPWGIVASLFYGGVFFLQAFMFLLFAGVLSQPIQLGFVQILEMVSVTWAAGFVVIGAPGGLGVREAAFSLFSETPQMKMSFLFVASWMRVSSILGDLVCFGLSILFLKSPVDTKSNGKSR